VRVKSLRWATPLIKNSLCSTAVAANSLSKFTQRH